MMIVNEGQEYSITGLSLDELEGMERMIRSACLPERRMFSFLAGLIHLTLGHIKK